MVLNVLLTTSGIGSRLGELTAYTNKSLVKVGDKYAICYIIEHYPIDTHFIITLGHYGEHVKDLLEIAYPDRKFTFVNVNNYSEAGSSLAYSLLQARPFINKQFVFHCCDSIVLDKYIPFDDNKNILFVCNQDNSSQYTSVNTHCNNIVSINDKGCTNFDYIYTGVSYIHNFNEFWENLENIYAKNPLNSQLSDIDSIREMLFSNEFIYKILNRYYDTGNIDSYSKLKTVFSSEYIVLEKNNESLCFLDDKVIKFISDPSINNKRFERGKILNPLVPRMFDSRNNFIIMDKIKGTVLSDVYNYGEIIRLLEWAYQYLWINKNVDNIYIENCYNFYINKTIKRLNTLPFLDFEINQINGITTKNIYDLIKHVNVSDIVTDTFYNFHGDFILDNILKTDTSYCLLDWRHEFDTQITHGDMYYDLAKLRHNIIFNHKNIANKLFTIKYDKQPSVTVDLKCNYFLIQQLEDYDLFIKKKNLDAYKVKLLTALIWLNMSPLYDGELREFLFYFGKYNLALALQQRP